MVLLEVVLAVVVVAVMVVKRPRGGVDGENMVTMMVMVNVR